MKFIKYIFCLLIISININAKDTTSSVDLDHNQLIDKKLKRAIIEFEAALHSNQVIPSDSIAMLYNRASIYAKQNNQPDLYFQLWNDFVEVTYTINRNVQAMHIESAACLEDAKAMKNAAGLIYALHCKARAYGIGERNDLALKHIEQCLLSLEGMSEEECKHLDVHINMPHILTDKIYCLLCLDSIAGVEQLIKEVESMDKSSITNNNLLIDKALYIATTKADTATAINLVEKAYDVIERYRPQKNKVHILVNIYRLSRNYKRELEFIKSCNLNDVDIYTRKYILSEQIDLLYRFNANKREIANAHSVLNQTIEQIKAIETQSAIDTYAHKMNQQEMAAERQQLQNELNKQKTSTSWQILISIMVIALVLIIFITYITRSNLRLRNYQSVLKKQNEELRETEEQLTNDIREMNASNDLKSAFLKNMSRDIQTPLNEIVQSCERLDAETNNDPELNKLTKIINNQSVQLEKIINDVMTISDLDNTMEVVNYEQVSLNELCNEIVQDVRGSIAVNVELIFNSWQDERPIQTSRKYLSLIVKHLLQNAAKFTQSGSVSLSIKTNEANDAAVIVVKDTGIGISEDHRNDIFDRFNKISEFSQGVGLGLSICAKAAELINAEITLAASTFVDNATQSNPSGATFVLTVPINN